MYIKLYEKNNIYLKLKLKNQEYKQAITEIDKNVANDNNLKEFDKQVEALLGTFKIVIIKKV